MEHGVDLGDAGVDADDFSGPLGQQVVAEPTSPIHLDEQATEVTKEIFARLQQSAALAAE